MVKRTFITNSLGDDALPKWASWVKVVVDGASFLQLFVRRSNNLTCSGGSSPERLSRDPSVQQVLEATSLDHHPSPSPALDTCHGRGQGQV